jgi:pantothenate synthetase
LEELDMVTGKALLSMAVFIGKTRLIDNVILDK